MPFVTVVIPCRNEEARIAQCLDTIIANDYPRDRLEILVVDGMSEDGTREVVADYVRRYNFVRLVDNPGKGIPEAMNTGIRNAQGDTIIKMDAHSTYQPTHIRLCVECQDKYGAENVGGVGRMSAGSGSATARAIVLGMGHRFGSGNARAKVGVDKPTWSDSVLFGCFKKDLFSRIGLFDERLKSSSDMDMNMRIRAAGGRILLVPEIVVNYYADSTLKKFVKHNFADGVWATYVLKFGSKGWSWRHWVPLGFLLSLLLSFALAPFLRPFLWSGLGILALYLATSLFVSLQIAIRAKDSLQLFLLPCVFAVRHFVHGAGALFGIFLILIPGFEWRGRRSMKG